MHYVKATCGCFLELRIIPDITGDIEIQRASIISNCTQHQENQ